MWKHSKKKTPKFGERIVPHHPLLPLWTNGESLEVLIVFFSLGTHTSCCVRPPLVCFIISAPYNYINLLSNLYSFLCPNMQLWHMTFDLCVVDFYRNFQIRVPSIDWIIVTLVADIQELNINRSKRLMKFGIRNTWKFLQQLSDDTSVTNWKKKGTTEQRTIKLTRWYPPIISVFGTHFHFLTGGTNPTPDDNILPTRKKHHNCEKLWFRARRLHRTKCQNRRQVLWKSFCCPFCCCYCCWLVHRNKSPRSAIFVTPVRRIKSVKWQQLKSVYTLNNRRSAKLYRISCDLAVKVNFDDTDRRHVITWEWSAV